MCLPIFGIDAAEAFYKDFRKDVGWFVPIFVFEREVIVAQAHQVQNGGDFDTGIFVVGLGHGFFLFT